MKIIIDKNIPYIQGALEDVAEVVYLPAKEMTPETVKNADALIIRTRTKCNKTLLDQSSVKIITTATIGYDHIDTEYCEKKGIKWLNSPGCNAYSVVQYIASVLSFLSKKQSVNLSTKTIGIVGVGAVGSKIAVLAKSFGMNVLLNDPPRARKEGSEGFVTLNEICENADIITFHPFLNMEGIDKTFHLADEIFFNSLKKKPIIINASRGEVVDANCLLSAIETGKISEVILDCWENEPDINVELLGKCLLATPHIAGYSADGKANATTQCVQNVSRFLNLGKDNWEAENLELPPHTEFISDDILDFFLQTYDIESDTKTLKNSPETFEQQRSDYWFRREPKGYISMMSENLLNKCKNDFNIFFQ